MLLAGRGTEPMLLCPHHGQHPLATFPASSDVSEDQLAAWLEGTRRIAVNWDPLTGTRFERPGRVVLDEARARLYARVLWLRFCREPPATPTDLRERAGLTSGRAAFAVRDGLCWLRDALRGENGGPRDALRPGMRLSVALYGCGSGTSPFT